MLVLKFYVYFLWVSKRLKKVVVLGDKIFDRINVYLIRNVVF